MVKDKKKNRPDDDSSENEEENTMMSQKQYNEFLNSIFPSTYMQNKIKEDDKKTKKKSKKDKEDEKNNKKSSKSPKKAEKKGSMIDVVFTIVPNKKKKDGDDDIEEDDYEDEDYEEDDDSDDEDYETEDDEDDSEEDDDDDEESDEDDEDESDEESEEESEEEEEEEEESEEESEEEEQVKKSRKTEKKNKNTKDEEDQEDIYEKFESFMRGIKHLKQNKNMQKEFKDFEKKIKKTKEKQDKKRKTKNLGEYMKMISNKNLINDVKFFKESMTFKEQEKMLVELEKVKSLTQIDKPYRIQLLENTHIPDRFKAIALKKINAMKLIADGGGEYNKLKNWIDTFMRIPFDQISVLPVEKSDPKEKIYEFMDKSQKVLDEAVYGMKDAKVQFMQLLAQWVANPQSIGNAIAIKGPMGTGKTTLIKYGVSKLLNREFAFIPLGGATDSSYLEGHSYTYEGSSYGKIVDILIQCKTSNPVIYFDELDKVSETPKGEEIIGILTHLTDTTQNDKFHDKYFSEIDFDLSKCLFIFSYNDESKINPILKDRMYNIETKGYDANEKVIICNDYLIPRLEKELNMEKGSIQINEQRIKHMVEKYTNEEKGVRNLKRCLEVIYSKLNLYTMMKPGTQLFGEKVIENITFPYVVDEDIMDKIIQKKNEKNTSHMAMYL